MVLNEELRLTPHCMQVQKAPKIGRCKFEGIYFVFFFPPQKEKGNPTHITAHLQTAANQPGKPKFTKELFFCPSSIK